MESFPHRNKAEDSAFSAVQQEKPPTKTAAGLGGRERCLRLTLLSFLLALFCWWCFVLFCFVVCKDSSGICERFDVTVRSQMHPEYKRQTARPQAHHFPKI